MNTQDLKGKIHQRTRKNALFGLILAPLSLLASPSEMLPSDGSLETPALAQGYRDSVRCMPSIQPISTLFEVPETPAPFPLATGEIDREDVALNTYRDGDPQPDRLYRGAESYIQSVACSPHLRTSSLDYRNSFLLTPAWSLKAQEKTETEELPAEEEFVESQSSAE